MITASEAAGGTVSVRATKAINANDLNDRLQGGSWGIWASEPLRELLKLAKKRAMTGTGDRTDRAYGDVVNYFDLVIACISGTTDGNISMPQLAAARQTALISAIDKISANDPKIMQLIEALEIVVNIGAPKLKAKAATTTETPKP